MVIILASAKTAAAFEHFYVLQKDSVTNAAAGKTNIVLFLDCWRRLRAGGETVAGVAGVAGGQSGKKTPKRGVAKAGRVWG